MSRGPVVVVGGGVIGCAILWELTRSGVPALLVEAEPDVGEGTSKANSAIVHTGFDAKPGTLEARLLRRAAELWPSVLQQLSVPWLAVGALMLARTAPERARLETEIRPTASGHGVRTEILDRDAVRDLAPYLADDVIAALSIPDEAIVDPFWLTRAYAEAALTGGAELLLGHAVTGLEPAPDGVTVRFDDGTVIRTPQVVDAAGIRADDVARLIGDDSFAIRPRKGQFLVSEETYGVDRIVLPIPGPMGKGMLVTPIVFGGLLLGPTAVDVADKDDRATDPEERARILAGCRTLVPAVAEMIPIRQFAGLRHVSSTNDFLLRFSTVDDRLYLAAGIRSTGISTSPAVAERVASDLLARRPELATRSPRAQLVAPAMELDDAPGEVVCLCRSISRGEVEAACARPTAPRTLDAIKRRGGATFGDCQGNLCALDVAQVIASARGVPLTAVEKHRPGSWLWVSAAGGPRPGGRSNDPPELANGQVDVLVVGGGRAGRGAAAAARDAGCSVLGVERRAHALRGAGAAALTAPGWIRATVVGLDPHDAGWRVLAQAAHGSLDLEARAVIVATGGYAQPREHRGIAGPRPAGVMTADLAWRALEAGLQPGRSVALVGSGRAADDLADALAEAGSGVTRLASAPTELRGERRLEAVRTGDRWQPVDALVLADRLLPQAFVLRGLGLLDDRPGTSLPVDGEGRLPLPGLWAAGCCVHPDLDHARCAEAGAAVAERVVRSLEQRSAGPASHPAHLEAPSR